MANHAGSWREFPVGRCIVRWRAGLLPPGKGLALDRVATTAGARRPHTWQVIEGVVLSLRCDPQQPAGERDAVLAGGAGEQAIMADPVEALRQHVEQEAADELVGGERHHLLPVGPAAAIILVAESD